MQDSHPFGPGILRGSVGEVVHVDGLSTFGIALGESVDGTREVEIAHHLKRSTFDNIKAALLN